jgi:vanillin dehydrogenase
MPISARDEHRGLGPDRGNLLDVPLLLRDQNLPASNGDIFERLSPITGEVVSRAAAATPADAVAAVASAAAAFPKWSAIGPGERRKRLLAAADIIEGRIDSFITAMAE